MASKRTKAAVTLDATVHKNAKRSNIPTAELEAFAEQHEKQPKTQLYPRDTSLDPQLVWRGKDDQDRSDLAVPVVPVYIQEKIHPRYLIEELRAEKSRREPQAQIDIFSDFNGLELEKLVDFYQHPMKWQNRMVLGDSLLVMASLAEKEGLKGKVQTVYMDPPYGIKFGSNWQVSTRNRDVKDGRADDATRQPEQIKAFRDTWEKEVHSYLSYIRDRLRVALDLLAQTGSIFVQIGDENVHLVRCVLDEVFGSKNFVSLISFVTTSGFQSNELARAGDYLLWYAKDKSAAKVRTLWVEAEKEQSSGYRWVVLPDETKRGLTTAELRGEAPFPAGSKLYTPDNLISQGSAGEDQAFVHQGKTYRPAANSHWKASFPEGMDRLAVANRIHVARDSIRYVRYADDFGYRSINSIWTDTGTGNFTDDKIFVVQTNTKVVERCLLMTTDPGDLVLDPTCGSGTTAYVAEQRGRRWITIDTSRVALALARTRLMAARFPYYLLADSAAGIAKETEITSGSSHPEVQPTNDVSKGFVYERAAHITLRAIATNLEIRDGMTSQDIESAISRHADREILSDRPYSDPKIVRVSGPFTVESLSPHRVLSPNDDEHAPEDPDTATFIDRILQNLKAAGVQNTVKGERLTFVRLDPWPGGVYIQAAGDYVESGDTKTVAVCIGPEYGTVGPELVREASKEAVRFADLLVVCGFAFEAHVGDETSKLGKLTILKAKMNPDLSMGDDLLKKTGAANLFMIFGEPDIEIEPIADGSIAVEIHGLDVYNPTTGEIRSDTTDEIACWFIDTDYNGESFFVRHAYFLGGDDPYRKLQQALRADIDQETWATLYSPKSRPFPKPRTGKIAIKVINHYGDEVLKVYPVDK